MSKQNPRTDLEIVIAEVRRRHNELAVNIRLMEALGDRPLSPETQVLLRYLVCGAQMMVAAWANDNGLKFKPPGGKSRDYKPGDVLSLLACPPDGWTPEMVAFAKSSCWDETGKYNTGKMMS